MSSSLKEKWNRDSQPACGNARTGGRGRARRAAVERMGAKSCRNAHGDSCTVLWRALLARPEVWAATGAASTPALPVIPQAGLLRSTALGRTLRLPPLAGPRGTLRTSRLPPFPGASGRRRGRGGGGGCPGLRFPRLRARPPPLAPPSSLLVLTSSWACWRSPSAVRPRGDQRPAPAKCEVR